jgi:hypothetical protein
MDEALDEIQYNVWTLDLPLRVILREIRNSNMCIPKRRTRWINFLEAHFTVVPVEAPLYCIMQYRYRLDCLQVSPGLASLYRYIIEYTRYSTSDTCIVLMRTNATALFNELVRRKIVEIRGTRARMITIS